MSDLLTQAEHDAVATAALLAEQVAGIVADGPSRDADITEAVHHIHAVQRMILAQAAARAYPGRYRLLGDVVQPATPSWWPSGPGVDFAAAVDEYRKRAGTS